MSETKLKINLVDGALEVEGSESFVREIYEEHKERLQAIQAVGGVQGKHRMNKPTSSSLGKKKGVSKKRGKRGGKSFSIVKDLDLSGRGGEGSLKDFFQKKSPSSAMQMNAVFVYYLSKTAKVENITPDHVYTCYKDVKKRTPAALHQSLLDTSYKNGWIDTGSKDDIKITIQGENLVEHELPKQPKKR